jgi:alkylation response protein AidB-like acyl-CoA dehydrogenase
MTCPAARIPAADDRAADDRAADDRAADDRAADDRAADDPAADDRAADDPAAAVRAELRQWIAAHWTAEVSLRQWRELLAGSGWACPSWPRDCCGRALAPGLASSAAAELAVAGVPGLPDGVGMSLVAPVLLEHGSDDLKRRFIPPTVTGDITWCQLFSEPGAGSDLAGLTTSAVQADRQWLVTGQKVWSTGAATADFGLLLARTNWDLPKHRGITAFVLPMRQPGVQVRPLRQMNGHASFNEVFIDSAVIPVGHVIGAAGAGWPVALTTLAHERRLAASKPAQAPAGASGLAWGEAIAERTAAAEPHKWYPQRAGRPDLVIERARAQAKNEDPVLRQEIAKLTTATWAARWTAARAAAERVAAERVAAERAGGRSPGPEGSLGKLASSEIARQAARVHGSIAGAAGMLAGPDAPAGGTIAEILLSVPAISIAGGTDEIQHTIIGERILGLPKEPDHSRDVPFRNVPRAGS